MTESNNENESRAEDHDRDVDFEPEEDLSDLGAAQAKVKKLKEELAKVKAEKQEYLDGWQRCKADSINARREALQAAERTADRSIEAFALEIIHALDGFDVAAGSEAWAEVNDGWRSGMEHVQSQLINALARHDILRFGKVGEQFDHALHEAIGEREDVAGEPGEIARILRYGYKTDGRILRPAQVIIKK